MEKEKFDLREGKDLLKTSELSGLEGLYKSLKYSIFSVLFVLLKDEKVSNFLFFAIPTVLDYVQIVQFVFETSVNDLWQSDKLFQDMINAF